MAREIDAALVGEAVKTIQMLAVDMVEKAQSGHPGAPMGLADIAFEIWTRQLRFDPAHPSWPDRDRFVLSCGHASTLLYGLLHLSGFELSLDDLRQFRQWGSKTPGHPEAHHTPGVELTTGPLGQGIATAVGMAAGLKMEAARLDPHAPGLINARVFGIASDGDLMEGVSAEASSLAGHLGLDNLVFFYDHNSITIDGETSLAFTEDVGARYEAYGWHVQRIDGHDHHAIASALDAAVAEPARPSLIVAKTHIGKGSPGKQDTSSAHGSPLGAEEVARTKSHIGWPLEPTFRVPAEVRALFAARAAEGAAERAGWQAKCDAVIAGGGAAAAAWSALHQRRLPDDLLAQLVAAAPGKAAATRKSSGVVQQKLAELVPALVGGSADLTPSTKTTIVDSPAIARGAFEGRNLHFGIREHAMGAFANGLALGGGFVPFTATFMVFSDYLRPAIRLAALSGLQVIFVFTHDSLYLGEDGPTHQPVEHYWALRAIPNLDLFRPADGRECAAAWAHACAREDGPTVLSLTRQSVPVLPRPEGFDDALMLRGGYVIDEAAGGEPAAVILATGSEVSLAIEAKRLLGAGGQRLRIVSVLCLEAFERQDEDYRRQVLAEGVPRCSIELGITGPWRGVVGQGGLTIGHDRFGYSAPCQDIERKLGLDPPAVAERIKAWLR